MVVRSGHNDRVPIDASVGRGARRLGVELRRIRLARGLSQREVVRRLGLSAHSNLVDYEQGRRIPPGDIVSACEALFELPKGSLERLRRTALAERADPDPVGAGVPAGWVPPAQLPADVPGFAGRVDQIGELERLLCAHDGAGTAVLITAIGGIAGVGKTALAMHWAHRVRDRYPDGQLYVNLRGFDPGAEAMASGEALRGFLDALGVPPERMPATPDTQAGLYRSLLTNRRVLVVLDNARDAEQVRPLLPGAPGCLVLVTSRNQLSGLVAANGAHPVTLPALPPVEARDLLAARIGRHRLDAEPQAVDEIVTRCAGLPLALAIVAARAAAHPRFPLADVAGELRDALDGLQGTEPATDLRAVFSWSYRALGAAAARLFRQVSLHPGPDLTAPAAASLAGLPLARVRRLLAELTGANLISEYVPGRYTLHDLLRAYAAERSGASDGEEDRRMAVHRVLDHYLHTGYAANVSLHPYRYRISLATATPGVVPEPLTDNERALAWLIAEHQVLRAAVWHAARNGFDAHAWQLSYVLARVLTRQGRWSDLLVTQHAALDAARRLADLAGQAQSHRHLGFAYVEARRFDDAHAHYRQALDLFRQLGEAAGQAYTHLAIGVAHDQQKLPGRALEHAEDAVRLFAATDDRSGYAHALNAIGWYRAELGDHRQAIVDCERALAIERELGDRLGAAHTWDSLGYIHHQLDDHAKATECFQRAIDLWRQTGSQYYTTVTLTRLGDTYQAAGKPDAARDAWRQAVDLLDELDHPDADPVRVKLVQLDQP
jgi:tetratricopeptide (TPR) repeat protein